MRQLARYFLNKTFKNHLQEVYIYDYTSKYNLKYTQSEIAKALKENKIYSELQLLTKFGYINCKGYPMKFKITNKGLKTLEVLPL